MQRRSGWRASVLPFDSRAATGGLCACSSGSLAQAVARRVVQAAYSLLFCHSEYGLRIGILAVSEPAEDRSVEAKGWRLSYAAEDHGYYGLQDRSCRKHRTDFPKKICDPLQSNSQDGLVGWALTVQRTWLYESR